ncbi:MAG TPA: NAD-dependent epimerase/dehydratase family protein [Gemmatimonadales bacterium]|jgi:dihydroflavonol-4-reductase
MRVAAVTGATGRIGAPLLAALRARGIAVRALTRSPRPPHDGVEWIVGDLLDGGVLRRLVDGADVLFHAAGQLDGDAAAVRRSLVDGTAATLAAAAGIRMVHVSSLVVLDTASARPIMLDTAAALEPTPARRGVYTQAKCAAEALVRAAALTQDLVLVRPGLVLIAGTNSMPPSVALPVGPFWLPVGPLRAQLPVVHADRVASGMIAAAEHARSGAIVHLLDDDIVTRGELLRQLRRDLPSRLRLPGGTLLLQGAVMAAAFSDLAYRVASAGRPHRWATTPSAG